MPPGRQGAGAQIPLADEPGHRRQTDHPQRRDAEGGHGPRHAATDPGHLADLVDAQGLGKIAGAEEQGDLHDALMDEMHQAADGAHGAEERRAQHDVGHLADGGIGQPALEVILIQRPQGAVQNGDRRDDRQTGRQSHPLREGAPEHVVDDPQHAERAALTTATACSRALTGAGAAIAFGSQPCSGTSAALAPTPPISRMKMRTKGRGLPSTSTASRVPPASVKSRVPIRA